MSWQPIGNISSTLLSPRKRIAGGQKGKWDDSDVLFCSAQTNGAENNSSILLRRSLSSILTFLKLLTTRDSLTLRLWLFCTAHFLKCYEKRKDELIVAVVVVVVKLRARSLYITMYVMHACALSPFLDKDNQPQQCKNNKCHKHNSQFDYIWPVIFCIESECGENGGARYLFLIVTNTIHLMHLSIFFHLARAILTSMFKPYRSSTSCRYSISLTSKASIA